METESPETSQVNYEVKQILLKSNNQCGIDLHKGCCSFTQQCLVKHYSLYKGFN